MINVQKHTQFDEDLQYADVKDDSYRAASAPILGCHRRVPIIQAFFLLFLRKLSVSFHRYGI